MISLSRYRLCLLPASLIFPFHPVFDLFFLSLSTFSPLSPIQLPVSSFFSSPFLFLGLIFFNPVSFLSLTSSPIFHLSSFHTNISTSALFLLFLVHTLPSYQSKILSPSPFRPFLFLLSLYPDHTLSSLPLTFSLRFLFCLSFNPFKLLSDLYFESSSFFRVIYHPSFLFSPYLFFVPLPFNTSSFTTFLKHHYCPSWSFSFIPLLCPLLFI